MLVGTAHHTFALTRSAPLLGTFQKVRLKLLTLKRVLAKQFPCFGVSGRACELEIARNFS